MVLKFYIAQHFYYRTSLSNVLHRVSSRHKYDIKTYCRINTPCTNKPQLPLLNNKYCRFLQANNVYPPRARNICVNIYIYIYINNMCPFFSV